MVTTSRERGLLLGVPVAFWLAACGGAGHHNEHPGALDQWPLGHHHLCCRHSTAAGTTMVTTTTVPADEHLPGR